MILRRLEINETLYNYQRSLSSLSILYRSSIRHLAVQSLLIDDKKSKANLGKSSISLSIKMPKSKEISTHFELAHHLASKSLKNAVISDKNIFNTNKNKDGNNFFLKLSAKQITKVLESELSTLNPDGFKNDPNKERKSHQTSQFLYHDLKRNIKKPIVDIKPSSELKFRSQKLLNEAKNLSMNLKKHIMESPFDIMISKVNEVIYMHLIYMKILLNHARASNNPINDVSRQNDLLNKFLTHFYHCENAMNYAFVLNKSRFEANCIDDMILLEDLSLLVYTQVFSHHIINKVDVGSDKSTKSFECYSDLSLFKSIMNSRKAASKTSQLKIPSICKDLCGLSNKFLSRIVMHKNLVPQLDLMGFKFDTDHCPQWLIDHFNKVYNFELKAKKSKKETENNTAEYINHHFGNFDVTRYLDLLENSLSKYVRFRNHSLNNTIGSPISSLLSQTNLNNQSVIKDIIAQRQSLAQKCGYSDYHQFILERSPRHVFNFKHPKESSAIHLEEWLLRVSKINRSIIKDFVNQTHYIINYQKEHDLRYLINKISIKAANSIFKDTTFFTVNSVLKGLSNLLSNYLSLQLVINYKEDSEESIKNIQIYNKNSGNLLSTVIFDLDFNPNKFLYQHRYEVNHICSRRNSDTNSILCILANQSTLGSAKSGHPLYYPLTFFQMIDFLYALGKCVEYSINSKRLFTTTSIPLGSENIIASFLIHMMTSENILKDFLVTNDFEKKFESHQEPVSLSKIFSWTSSIHKVTDLAEKSNKALFDLHSHSHNKVIGIFKSEKFGSLNSSLLFKNWNSCYPLLMDRKNRFFYSFSHAYVNFYATTYYTNIVAEIAAFSLTNLMNNSKSPGNLLSKFTELLDPTQPGLDETLCEMTNYEHINTYFKYYATKIRSIPLLF